MGYATASDLLAHSDVEELAQATGPTDKVAIDGDLLRLTVDGGDRSSYSTEAQAAADEALVRINEALATAESEINGYLATRYTTPLANPPKVLVVQTCRIAFYYAMGSAVTEREGQLYSDALKFVNAVSRGLISLGSDGVVGTPASTDDGAEMDSVEPVWKRSESSGFI